MKLPSFRLSTRITVAALAIVVAGAMALMFIENARIRDVYLNEQSAHLEQELHAEKSRMKLVIDTLRQDVLFLSNTPPVSGIVRAALNHGYDTRDGDTSERWKARLQQIFAAFSAARPEYFQVRYIGVADGGRELVRIDNHSGKIEITPPDRLQAKGGRDYFNATKGLRAGEVYLSEFNLNQEMGVIEKPYRPTLRVATPVFTPSGQIFGMVVINMEASHLLASAARGLPAGALAYITNMNGEYLLHPDARRSFGFELGSKDNITADFPFLETMFNPRAPEHLPLQAVATKTGTQYLASERIHFDPGDPARFLLLTYHLPDAVVEKQIMAIPARHIIGGFIAMLLIGSIVLLVLRRTFAPLKRITDAAREITAGNRHFRLTETVGGEIGELANTLNGMLDRLSDSDLIEREHAFQKRIIETAHDGFWLADTQGNLLGANQAYADMSGYTADELVGMHISQLEAKEQSVDEVKAHVAKIIAEGSDMFETRHRHKDGHEIDIEVSTTFMRESQQFVAFLRDITWRKKAEEAKLRESDDRFRGTLEQAAVGIVHATMDGCFRQANQKLCSIVGYARDDLLKLSFQDITFPADLAELDSCFQQLLADAISAFSVEVRYVCKSRESVWVNLTVSLLRDADGTAKYYIGVIEDITQRRQADMELNQSRKLLRELVVQSEALREEERKRIARELHDELGQILTALRMNVALLRIEFGEHDDALQEKIKRITGLLDQSIQCTRDVVTNLRPAALDMGIVPAIRWLCDEFIKHSGTPCVLNAPEEGINLDEILAMTAFRIVQESLTNAARYAEASKVEVTLMQDADNFSVTINDNGKGFDYMAISNHKSFGLLGMRERAIALGGVVNIYSAPQQGTQIFFVVPNKQTFTDTQGDNP